MGRKTTHPIQEETYFKYNKLADKSTCQICKKVYVGKHSANLEKHYKADHPDIFKDIKRKKELNLSWYKKNADGKKRKRSKPESSDDSGSESDCVLVQQKITDVLKSVNISINISPAQLKNACLELITVNGRPISILEDSGFIKIIDCITKGFLEKTVVNKENIRQMIHPKAVEIKQKIIQEVKNKMISLKVDACYQAK